MDAFIVLIRILVIFIATTGFLFGQLFSGYFALGPSLAGIFGLLGGALSGGFAFKSRQRAVIVISCCLLSLLGIVLDAYHYYKYLDSSGNYYAWLLIAPFAIFLFILMLRIKMKMPAS